MADLSIYLFWTGFLLAIIATGVYVAYAVGGTIAMRRMSAQTSAGPVMISTGPVGPNPALGRLATAFTSFTVLALAGAVATRWIAVEHPPFSNLYEFTVAFGFAIAAAYLAFEVAAGQRRFGLVALPIVIAMLFIASLFPSDIVPLVPALQNGPLMAIHVSTIMAAYAALTVSFCGAVVYLIQGGRGKRRFALLPTSESAEEFAHRAVVVGSPLLLLGIALGAWWANSAWGRYWGWDPKETAAAVTWLSTAAYFHARAGTGTVANAAGIRKILPASWRNGWRPDPMWWLIAMYVLVLFTYFGVNLWITGLHSYAGV